jgi:hypothetical protein
MSRQVQLRRGTAVQHQTFTGLVGELTMNTSNNSLRLHDNVTVGGHEMLKSNLSNVLISSNGTFSLLDNLGGQTVRITNVADPVDDQDVATKAYVDTHGGGATSLDQLTDVAITDVNSGEVLKYDGTNFVNAVLSSADLSDVNDLATTTITDNLQNDINDKLDSADFTATNIKNLLNADNTGLDADLLDGFHSTDFVQITALDTTLGNVQGAIPTLDENGHIKSSQLPDLAITHVDSGLLADIPLPDENNVGDVYITTDTFQTFISTGTEWLEILNPSASQIADLQTELNTTQSSLGLDPNGARPVYSSTIFIADIDSHHVALGKLDTALSNIDTTISGYGTSVGYDAGTQADQVLLLDNTGAIDSAILNLATTIGGVNIGDILTTSTDINALIDINTLKGDLDLASTDLTDSNNLPRLDALTNTFTGEIASDVLTITTSSSLAEATATTPDANDDSTRVATTEWVVDYVDANGGGGGGATTLDQLNDVNAPAPNTNDVLLYSGTEWINSVIDIAIISNTGSSVTYDAGTGAGEVLLLDNTGAISSTILNLATTIGGVNIGDILTINDDITSLIDVGDLNLSINDLTDVDITGIQNNQTLVWNTNQFVPTNSVLNLIDDQGRFIEAFDCGLVTDLIVGSTMDWQDADGNGGTPFNFLM